MLGPKIFVPHFLEAHFNFLSFGLVSIYGEQNCLEKKVKPFALLRLKVLECGMNVNFVR